MRMKVVRIPLPRPQPPTQAGTRQLDQSAHINTTLLSPRKCHEVIVVDSGDLGRYLSIMTVFMTNSTS